MSERPVCPSCGDALPANSPRELCARCLFRVGMESGSTGPSRNREHGATAGQTVTAGHVLDAITATIGPVPCVLLRDTDGGTEPRVYRPGGAADLEFGTRYRIDGEIARGGMGAVLRGRDPDLGRDVALKVLREDLRDDAEMVRRFVEEAQIGGQLQHPGIVPIYEMGAFTDRRPYFAMKLVKGRTLSSLLDERQPPVRSSSAADAAAHSDRGMENLDRGSEAPLAGRWESARDLSRFVSIFEAVCQTIAYAHARGVIHRDLKPSNIMVGAFGEVQVMDWGLAKVLPQGGAAHDASAGKSRTRETVIATARSGSGTDTGLSKAGSVMGTPSYMAPEQARGETDRLDERCDVFALGSILCELLTGEPAFTGRSSGEIQSKAARGALKDATDRLNSCDADAELIALAKDCIAPEQEERPRHASEVAARINAYQTGVQDRLRRAEIARAEEKARALEATKRARVERHRLRLTIALAASLIVLLVVGGGGAFWAVEQQRNRRLAASAIVARVETLHEQAKTQAFNPVAWRVALASADQALAGMGGLASSPPGRHLAALRIAIVEDEKQAERDNRLLTELANTRATRASRNSAGPAALDQSGYLQAFERYGLDLTKTSVDQAVARLKSLPVASQREIVGFLDDCVSSELQDQLRRSYSVEHRGYEETVAKLMAVARGLDSDPQRNQLRSILPQPNLQAHKDILVAMSKTGRAVDFGASTSILLASALEKAGEQASAIAVLRAAVVRYPGDLWANLALAQLLSAVDPPRPDEVIRYYAIVRALRPVAGSELANSLFAQGQADEAEAIRRELARLEPDSLEVSGRLFELLENRGKNDEARAILKSWIDRFRREPDNPGAHLNIGLIYRKLHDLPHETADLREAARLGANHPDFSHELGHRLFMSNDLPGAIEAYRDAIRIFPEDINCHYELASTLCLSRDHAGEIAALREAIRLESTVKNRNPPRPPLALRLEYPPFLWEDNVHTTWNDSFDDFEQGHTALGTALLENGELERALAEYRTATRLGETEEYRHYQYFQQSCFIGNNEPSYPHHCLGLALDAAGDVQGAIAELREAIRINPTRAAEDDGFPLCLALVRAGDAAGAIAVVKQAIEQAETHRLEPLSLLRPIVFASQGAQTITTLRRIREAAGDDQAVIGWIDSAILLTERITALRPRLPRIAHRVGGASSGYADVCYRRRYFAASAGLWSAAFAVDSSLAAMPDKEYRLQATCAAAMAGCGEGKDDPAPDETAKAKLRRQALDWLTADLTSQAKLLEGGKPEDRSGLVQTLRIWKFASELAGVRDEASLQKLPQPERKEWQTFWSDVEAQLNRAEAKAP